MFRMFSWFFSMFGTTFQSGDVAAQALLRVTRVMHNKAAAYEIQQTIEQFNEINELRKLIGEDPYTDIDEYVKEVSYHGPAA